MLRLDIYDVDSNKCFLDWRIKEGVNEFNFSDPVNLVFTYESKDKMIEDVKGEFVVDTIDIIKEFEDA